MDLFLCLLFELCFNILKASMLVFKEQKRDTE